MGWADAGRPWSVEEVEVLRQWTMRVNDCVAFGRVPLLAVKVSLYEPDLFGIPLSTPLVGLKLTPEGSDPETFSEG